MEEIETRGTEKNLEVSLLVGIGIFEAGNIRFSELAGEINLDPLGAVCVRLVHD